MAFNTPSLIAGFTILTALIIFMSFFLIRRYKILDRFLIPFRTDPVISYFVEKLTGFLLFGVLPYLLFIRFSGLKASETVLFSSKIWRYWYILVPVLLVVSILMFIASKKKTTQARYPQLRIKIWSVKYSLISISGWIIYLLGYEFFFRGILWFACFRAFGFWLSLLINITLYAIAHFDQGAWISIGAGFVGIIFCLLASLTGSFVFAFLIHSWMAISNEIFSIYHNPELRFHLTMKRSLI